MHPRVKLGLGIGVAGLFVNIFVSMAFGFCGPGIGLVAGALAGFLTARQEKAVNQGEGAKLGAVSGAIAGALVFIGQIIAGLAVLVLIQYGGLQSIFGKPPQLNADMAHQLLYYLSGAGTAACFGVVGIVLASLAGAALGYLGTSKNRSPDYEK